MTSFHRRTIIVAMVVGGLLSSGLTFWLMSPQELIETKDSLARYARTNSEPPVSPPVENTALIEQFMQIQTQIDAMDKRLAKLARESANPLDTSVSAISDQAGAPKVQPDDANQALQQHVAQIADRFQMEETDTAWADNVAEEIQDAFLADGIVGNSSLDNVDCRTSLCKLEVSFNDIDGLAGVRNQLVEKIGETLPYGAIQPGASDSEVIIYLGSKSEAFSP